MRRSKESRCSRACCKPWNNRCRQAISMQSPCSMQLEDLKQFDVLNENGLTLMGHSWPLAWAAPQYTPLNCFIPYLMDCTTIRLLLNGYLCQRGMGCAWQKLLWMQSRAEQSRAHPSSSGRSNVEPTICFTFPCRRENTAHSWGAFIHAAEAT